MKFTISGEKSGEPEIELWLQTGLVDLDTIILKGKDRTGTLRNLMRFTGGRFYRIENAKLDGLKTNEEGKIIEEIN